MKTIPELRKELADQKLKLEYYEGQKEARNLKKEIFKLKHPTLMSAGRTFKKVGQSVSKNTQLMGKTIYKAGKSQAHEIKKEQLRKGYHSNNILRKRPVKIKIITKHKRHKKRHSRPVSRPSKSNYNPMNPFNLDF